MSPDIIDNRADKLTDYILKFLGEAQSAKFAVGYLFLSGLEALGPKLDEIGDLRLLIGNSSNRQTIEQLAAAYKNLDTIADRQMSETFLKRADRQQRANEAAVDLRETVAIMDQTDTAQELAWSLMRMVEEGRLKVRVYTKGRLHAKAYIFDWARPNPTSSGVAIVGSSNLSLAGIQSNTELNVVVHDNAKTMDPSSGNHGALTAWFNELWNESEEFDELLMTELRASWVGPQLASPYDIYLKTLYTLVGERLDEEEPTILPLETIYEELADFQRIAVEQAVRIIDRYRGCFVSDVVGLGKSYIGAAITKYYERVERRQPLIICPKALEEMWRAYSAIYELNAAIVPMSMLLEAEDSGVNLLADVQYRNRDFVLVDESHNFRNSDTQRYRELQSFLNDGNDRKVCLLTATPLNSRPDDVLNQIRLFHPDDRTDLPIDPPSLSAYFNKIKQSDLSAEDGQLARLQGVLSHLLIRRTRRHILRWYGIAEDTGTPLRELSGTDMSLYLDSGRRAYIEIGDRRNYFPVRELKTLRYSIEATYSDGLYDQLRNYLGRPRKGRTPPSKRGNELTYARYGLWNYLQSAKRGQPPYDELRGTGQNLRGLMRTMLFKRFESSVHAFRCTLQKMIQTHDAYLRALDDGIVPAGRAAEGLISRSSIEEEDDLFDALREVTGRYSIADFRGDQLREDIAADIDLFGKMIELVAPITPEADAKLQSLINQLAAPDLANKKVLIFTQYADTATYLHKNLNPNGLHDDIEVISGSAEKDVPRIVARFAPEANPNFPRRSGDTDIRILVSTDVLAEGLNLQDGSVVINYDLHWNPVRLIQRFGRIDRIGTEHDVVYGYNFLPERGLERNLGIHEVLRRRIQEIHDTIGEDAYILDPTERLNEEAMYAIYQGKPAQLSFFANEADVRGIDLNEAEELLRQLREDDPQEFQRIVELRDGIRSARPSGQQWVYVFCRAGEFRRLYLIDEDDQIVTTDVNRVLGTIQADVVTQGLARLPADYNSTVMSVKRKFIREVQEREAGQDQFRRTRAQEYVRQQLQYLHRKTESEEQRRRISILERLFTDRRPTEAVRRELIQIHRNHIGGVDLFNRLTEISINHALQQRQQDDSPSGPSPSDEVPRIVCSMALP